jgi:hypothetical protein
MDLESELACHMKMKVISAKGNVSKDMRSYYSNFKHSDTVDDRCRLCGGDGTECTIVKGTFTENGKGYKKITTIPAGSKRISIEELKPSINTLALKAEDDKTFYLNGDYQAEPDRELHIAGTVGYYFHPEHELEKIVIAGPTTSKILVYACFFGEPNPGTRYSYAVNISSQTSGYVPKYHWEFMDWEECSSRCGGGTQESQPKCVEEPRRRLHVRRDGQWANGESVKAPC